MRAAEPEPSSGRIILRELVRTFLDWVCLCASCDSGASSAVALKSPLHGRNIRVRPGGVGFCLAVFAASAGGDAGCRVGLRGSGHGEEPTELETLGFMLYTCRLTLAGLGSKGF